MQYIIFFAFVLLFNSNTSAQLYKMSPKVRNYAIESLSQNHRKSISCNGAHEDRRISVFVRSNNVDELREQGAQVLASFDDIYIASVTLNSLNKMAALKSVSRIEAGNSCSLMLDTATIMTKANKLWFYNLDSENVKCSYGSSSNAFYDVSNHSSYSGGYTGQGVVVGLMDVGFDLTHPTFYSEDGNTYRIKALWDQLDYSSNGLPYKGDDTIYVGRQYLDEESLLKKGRSVDGIMLEHGSHTCGIAAGSGAPIYQSSGDPIFKGMAFESDICLVANAVGSNKDSIPADMLDIYTTATDALGFKYIFDYAAAHNQPCVISFSEGYHPDFYGQDILYAEVLNKMMGPGKILCASAGNEADNYSNVLKPLGTDKAGAFISARSTSAYYTIRSTDKMTIRVTFYPYGQDKVVRDIHTQDIIELKDSMFIDTINVYWKDHVFYMAAYPSCYNKKEWAHELLLKTCDDSNVGGEVPISITLLGDTLEAEAYSLGGYFAPNSLDNSLRDYIRVHNICNPGGLPGVICVGSNNSRHGIVNYRGEYKKMEWGEIDMYSKFASVGPALDGSIKPDVVAPGNAVYSAGSSYCLERDSTNWAIIRKFNANGRLYDWKTNCGTSMSCPAAAGVIALWLQACPTLTPEQVMDVIAASSKHPDSTMEYPNNYYGYGAIDAEAGFKYIFGKYVDTIKDIYDNDGDFDCNSKLQDVWFDLQGRRASQLIPGRLYIHNGKKIKY